MNIHYTGKTIVITGTKAGVNSLTRLGKPEEIADVAACLASDYASFINGVVIPVDGGIEAMLATTPID